MLRQPADKRFERLTSARVLAIATQLAMIVAVAGCMESNPNVTPFAESTVLQVDPSIVAPGSPVFYYIDPSDPRALDAYRWDGSLAGRLTFAAALLTAGVDPAPQGSRLLTSNAPRTGARVVGGAPLGKWASDSAHMCVFLQADGIPGNAGMTQIQDAYLFFGLPGGAWRRVVQFGEFTQLGEPMVLACDPRSKRAIVAESFTGRLSQVTLVDLGDGSTQRLPDPATGEGAVIASADARYIAEEASVKSCCSGSDSFIVRDVTSKQIVATIAGYQPEAFSGDDSRVLGYTFPGNSSEVERHALFDWRTGQRVWSGSGGPGTVLSEPGAASFLIGYRTMVPVGNNRAEPSEDVILVGGDGSWRLILHAARPIS